MALSFNLIDEGFIPCLMADGSRREWGLLETLVHAHEIKEIRDDSPLVTVSLHRLLLAILHRVLVPQALDDWARVWQRGAFEADALREYFSRWHGRFDLCDACHPFYQVAALDDTAPTSIWRLAFVQSNNATLFDHRNESEAAALMPAVAARLLIAYQAFAIGGGVSKPFNLSHSPLVRQGGFLVMAVGDTLFQTLWLNTIPRERQPVHSLPSDCPAWEREEASEPRRGGTPIRGFLDYLTWQSRRVKLIPDDVPELRFSQVLTLQGHALPDHFGPQEPMFAYVRHEKHGWLARSLREGQAVWRDSEALLRLNAEDSKPPAVVMQLGTLRARRLLQDRETLNLAIFGLCSDRAKLAFWRHETLPLPLEYLADRELVDTLARAIKIAEDAASSLWGATTRLIEALLSPDGQRKPLAEDVARLRDSFRFEEKYWSQLERQFRDFLLRLPGDEDHQGRQLADWTRTVSGAARRTFDLIVRGLDASPRTLRAVYGQGAIRVLNVKLAQLSMKEDDNG